MFSSGTCLWRSLLLRLLVVVVPVGIDVGSNNTQSDLQNNADIVVDVASPLRESSSAVYSILLGMILFDK